MIFSCRRPTHRPEMRLQHSFLRSPDAATTQVALRGYLAAVADLAAPKRALALLWDASRLDTFHAGISAALQVKPSAATLRCNCHLCLQKHTGLLLCLGEHVDCS